MGRGSQLRGNNKPLLRVTVLQLELRVSDVRSNRIGNENIPQIDTFFVNKGSPYGVIRDTRAVPKTDCDKVCQSVTFSRINDKLCTRHFP